MFAVFIYGCSHNAGAGTGTQEMTEAEEQQQPSPETAKTVTIEITSSGFQPASITINAGDTVNFINKDSRGHWPASDVHPTHTRYPGSSIGKCGTDEATDIFDACKSLAMDETYSFTFIETGSWGYHDHLIPSLRGMIEVV